MTSIMRWRTSRTELFQRRARNSEDRQRSASNIWMPNRGGPIFDIGSTNASERPRKPLWRFLSPRRHSPNQVRLDAVDVALVGYEGSTVYPRLDLSVSPSVPPALNLG